MTDRLREIAEDGAAQKWGTSNHTEYWAYIDGFIAGRTSVTREQILEVVAPFMHDEFVQGQEYPADEECADAVLALLNGENDD